MFDCELLDNVAFTAESVPIFKLHTRIDPHHKLRMNCGGLADTPHMNFLLSLPGLRDVIRRLHPHEGIHFDAEGLFNA